MIPDMNVYKGLWKIWHVCMGEDSSHDMMTVVGESFCPCALEQDVKQKNGSRSCVLVCKCLFLSK